MSFLDALKGTVETRSISFQDIWDKALDLDNVGGSHAGVNVNRTSAMQLSSVYGSWRIISEGVSTLPRDAMIRRNGVPKPFRPRPVWLDTPNPVDMWVEFLGQVMVSLLANGNAYVVVQWSPAGQVLSLTTLDPNNVTPERVNGLTAFKVMNPTSGADAMFPPALGIEQTEVLHFRGMSLPGSLVGINPIEACAETFGISLAAQRYGAGFFSNDGTPGGIIEVPPEAKLSPTGQKALRTAWRELYGGPSKAKSVAVLVDGAKFKPLQVNPDEAQFLETRKFQVADIARIYGVPPHLLADATGSTSWGSGLAEQNTAYVTYTLRAWLERIESRLTHLLRLELMNMGGAVTLDGPQAFIDLNEEALLRGASKERWDTHRANVIAGVRTADEVRKDEGYGPLPDELGAVPWIPLAQAPGGKDPQADEPPVAQEGNEDEGN